MPLEPEAVAAWLANLHISSHSCSDPSRCRLPATSGSQLASGSEKDKGHISGPTDETELENNSLHQKDSFINPGVRQRPSSPSTRSCCCSAQPQSLPSLCSSSTSGSYILPFSTPMQDLLKLQIPVRWVGRSDADLWERIARTGNQSAITIFNKVKHISLGQGHLPKELQELLRKYLFPREDKEQMFAPRGPAAYSDQEKRARLASARRILGLYAPEEEVARLALITGPLEEEFRTLQSIVEQTMKFLDTKHNKSAWNSDVYKPILNLAVHNESMVDVEDVTDVKIAKPFRSQAAADTLLSSGAKTIDYVLLLQYDRFDHSELLDRVKEFVSGLNPSIFNQAVYNPLNHSPTGVFLATKTDDFYNGQTQCKGQLGFWLASWFMRISEFPSKLPARRELPFIPVLLAVGGRWELHFAFDEVDEFCVYGPLDIGGTWSLDGAYRLLAALRVLSQDWMAGEFKEWVETLI